MNTKTIAPVRQGQSLALAMPNPEKIKQLDLLSRQYSGALENTDSPFEATMTLAVAMNSLRDLLTPDVMAPIMALMNSPLGFLTDRTGLPGWKNGQRTEPKPFYTENEVRDCMIEGVLRGFRPVGNEINIIASRFYAAKAGLRRRVTTYPGISDFRDTYEVPRVSGEKGAVVKCSATWNQNGKPDSIDREFAVKGDAYATADSYSGKAERKLLNAVFLRISGISLPDGEVNEDDLANAKNVTPASAGVAKPDFTAAKEPKPKREKGGEKEITKQTTEPALGEHGDTEAAAEASAPEGPTNGTTQGAESASADEKAFSSQKQISVYLADIDFAEKRFMDGVRMMTPDVITPDMAIVKHLPDNVAAQMIEEGLDDVIKFIKIKEAKSR